MKNEGDKAPSDSRKGPAYWEVAGQQQVPDVPGPRGIAARLMWARMRRGLGLRAVADMGKVSISTISRIEKGESDATAAMLFELAAPLGVNACWLAFGAGQIEAGAKEA